MVDGFQARIFLCKQCVNASTSSFPSLEAERLEGGRTMLLLREDLQVQEPSGKEESERWQAGSQRQYFPPQTNCSRLSQDSSDSLRPLLSAFPATNTTHCWFRECRALYLGGILCAACNLLAQLATTVLGKAAASSKAARSKVSQQQCSVTAQLSR